MSIFSLFTVLRDYQCNGYYTAAECCSAVTDDGSKSCFWNPECGNHNKRCTSNINGDCGVVSSNSLNLCRGAGEYLFTCNCK